MTLKHKTYIGLLLALMSSISSVMAATIPATVTDMRVVTTGNGGIAVSWSPAKDAVQYNVYYGRASIIGNNGDYDDFETTVGAETTYIFTESPVSNGTLFVAVLAVSETGDESEGFASEASIEVVGAASSSSSVASAENTTTSAPLSVKNVTAVSSTGVIVQFSKALKIDGPVGPGTFIVTDTGGVILRIREVSFLDAVTLLLKTESQNPTKKYIAGFVQNVEAVDGTSVTPSVPRMMFDAFRAATTTSSEGMTESAGTYGKNPALGVSSSSQPAVTMVGPSLVDVQVLKERDGTKTVQIDWTPTPSAIEYLLYTSTDGETFKKVGSATALQSSAKLKKITSANLIVKVTAKNAEGQESEGLTKTVPMTSGTSTPLAESGLPLLGVMLAAGALTGRRALLRKKK